MTKLARRKNLLSDIICPHCWETFPPEQILFVSEHQDLLGDPFLGDRQRLRFPASRFNLAGDAIDARGMVCRTLACPRCHLVIHRGSLELETLFLSVLGSASSGKSYFLAAMMSQLRKVLPFDFSITLTDVDPETNRILNVNEASLTHNEKPDEFYPLSELIKKTELEGEDYDQVVFGHQRVRLPRPFLFAMYPQGGHPNGATNESLARLVCLYDNAGEHFEPGKDDTQTPVTRHLPLSKALFFVFDPTQDQQFRRAMASVSGVKPVEDGRPRRQEVILNEAAKRIRRDAGLGQSEKHKRPLIVVVTKSDQWSGLFLPDDSSPPWKKGGDGSGNLAGLDVDRIEKRSKEIETLFLEHCREIVAAANGLSDDVTYIAVSALGPAVTTDPITGVLGIRPSEIRPDWVTIPYLYALSRVLPGLVLKLKRKPPRP